MKRLSIILAIVLLAPYLLTSCMLLEPLVPPETTEVTIIYPDHSETHAFEIDNCTRITPKYITGKVLRGYYEQNGTSGIQFIDSYGEMTGTWQKHYPSTLYAVYDEIDYTKTYHSNIQYDENPVSFHAFKDLKIKYNDLTQSNNSRPEGYEEFAEIISQNTYLELHIEFHCMIKCAEAGKNGKTEINLQLGNESVYKINETQLADGWREITLPFVVKVKQVYGNSNAYYLEFEYIQEKSSQHPMYNYGGLVKNVYYVASIVKPE